MRRHEHNEAIHRGLLRIECEGEDAPSMENLMTGTRASSTAMRSVTSLRALKVG